MILYRASARLFLSPEFVDTVLFIYSAGLAKAPTDCQSPAALTYLGNSYLHYVCGRLHFTARGF
jgi:hypothetical protein